MIYNDILVIYLRDGSDIVLLGYFGDGVEPTISGKLLMSDDVYKFDLTGQAFKRDPFPTFRDMRDIGPLVTSRLPIAGKITFATTYEAATKLLKQADGFSVELSRVGNSRFGLLLMLMPGVIKLLSKNMLQQDDPEHRRLRQLVDGAFRRQEIAGLETAIERIALELMQKLKASDDGDLVQHVARDLPLAVISELLGLPPQDRDKFHNWMAVMTDVSSAFSLFKIMPSLNKIIAYMRGVIEQRRLEPRDDLISALVLAEEEGDQLSDDEIVSMVFLLFAAGHETTTHLISGGTLALLQNKEQMERLFAAPSLLPSAVDELLRFVSPVQMTKPRFVVEDCEFMGRSFKRGQMLMALLASANSDEAAFDAPDQLELSRQPNRHLAFGAGPHFCLGAWLARKEMEIYLGVLMREMPDVKLAIGEDEVRWTKRGGMRALRSLPLMG